MFSPFAILNSPRQWSSKSCQSHRYVLKLCFVSTLMFLFVEAMSQNSRGGDQHNEKDTRSDKRPARLAYFRAPNSAYNKGRYRVPWESLPASNCLRKFCRSDEDCCRRHSKCNTIAQICYDCWYGHPCHSHGDCCERYPICNPSLRTCGK